MSLMLITLAWTIAMLLLVPLGMLGLQCVLALLPAAVPPLGKRQNVAVLIPAHNEAAGLKATLALVQEQLSAGDRVVVVADNCDDATAEIARLANAEVVERTDLQRRGKGFALDAGVRYLEKMPPEIVIVLDADCQIEPKTLDQLARTVDATGRPAQALYLMRMPRQPGPEATVSVFAFLIKNWVRPRAMQRLGLPVLLTGSGMAFPWSVIRDAPLASGEIVEDMVLGLELSRRQFGPVLCESARVWSELPSNPEAAISQRTRWEHGYLGTMLHAVPNLLWFGLCNARWQLCLIAFDLLVPPLSLLVLVSALGCAVLFLSALATGVAGPLYLLLLAGALTAVSIALCWSRFASDLIPTRVVFAIPGYVFQKIGIYRRFFGKRQTEWVRTQRDGDV